MKTVDEFKKEMVESIDRMPVPPKSIKYNSKITILGQRHVFASKIILDTLSKLEFQMQDAVYVLDKVTEIIKDTTKLNRQYIEISDESFAKESATL